MEDMGCYYEYDMGRNLILIVDTSHFQSSDIGRTLSWTHFDNLHPIEA